MREDAQVGGRYGRDTCVQRKRTEPDPPGVAPGDGEGRGLMALAGAFGPGRSLAVANVTAKCQPQGRLSGWQL